MTGCVVQDSMEHEFDHNKLLKKIAVNRLTPYGIIQQGKSRTFLYDKGWWTIVIEFQPSSHSKGAYLNIGLDFNFYPRAYFAFTYGSREKSFEEATDEKHFSQIINDYCDFTIKRVEELKLGFKDIWTATETFKKEVSNEPWNNVDLGVLYGLTGQVSKSKNILQKLKKEKCQHDYEFARQQFAIQILSWCEKSEVFPLKIQHLINETRQLKKLPVADLSDLLNQPKAEKGMQFFIYKELTKLFSNVRK